MCRSSGAGADRKDEGRSRNKKTRTASNLMSLELEDSKLQGRGKARELGKKSRSSEEGEGHKEYMPMAEKTTNERKRGRKIQLTGGVLLRKFRSKSCFGSEKSRKLWDEKTSQRRGWDRVRVALEKIGKRRKPAMTTVSDRGPPRD